MRRIVTVCAVSAACLLAMNTIAIGQVKILHVINDSPYEILGVLALSGADGSEQDYLQGSIAPGEAVSVQIDDGLGNCQYYLTAVLENGDKIGARDVDICETDQWRILDGDFQLD